MRLAADGRDVMPNPHGLGYRIRLPAGAARLTLRSRTARPSDLDPASNDTRRLGAALLQLRLDGAEVVLSEPRLCSGWLPAEDGLRWSNGAGEIDVQGASTIDLRFGAWLRYLVPQTQTPKTTSLQPEHRQVRS